MTYLSQTTITPGLKVAVIGSGIAGLGAAYGLARGGASVTVYEKDERLGGHANTVEVDVEGTRVAVDTGFIVYNEKNYQNLVGLFDTLGVETAASDMSFAASFNNGKFEYAGSGPAGLLARRRNTISPQFWSMMRDLIRFYKTAPDLLEEAAAQGQTLGTFLDERQFGETFRALHLLPMAAAIWSSPMLAMADYPVETFMRFFCNHGLLSLGERPKWRTVKGGSRQYVDKLVAATPANITLKANVRAVVRQQDGVCLHFEDGRSEIFDHCVFATHAPDALDLLEKPLAQELSLLSCFQTHSNEAVLHTDTQFMPRRKRAWASWNYIARQGAQVAQTPGALPCLTYWMNNLQPLATSQDLFVTLNPDKPVAEAHVLRRFSYNHPAFDLAAIQAQAQMPTIQGQGGVWYAGAWMGYGFHEDGLEAGLGVAEAMTGVSRPWGVTASKLRVPLPLQPMPRVLGQVA
ncbi:MAG: NAD(P)/FAD-dependent oxidoreductase [Alphaproteobacteria bacterium]